MSAPAAAAVSGIVTWVIGGIPLALMVLGVAGVAARAAAGPLARNLRYRTARRKARRSPRYSAAGLAGPSRADTGHPALLIDVSSPYWEHIREAIAGLDADLGPETPQREEEPR